MNINQGIINIKDNNYTSAEVNNIQIEGKNIGKCFHGDLVEFNENKKIKVLQKNIKEKKIVGILELFSSYKYPANKKGIERFKFVPLSKNYPCFLVSSKCKSKYTSNIIVVIKYLNWNDTLPYGEIIIYLGDIYSKSSIYESILFKNNLIQEKYNLSKVKRNFCEIDFESHFFKKQCFRNLTHENIISIDPEGTKDIDDAFHFTKISTDHFKLAIHISNVIDMLTYLRVPFLLDTSIISSIYSPEKVYPMFDSILSENYLSLRKDKKRLAITLWLEILDEKIIKSHFEKTIIQNKKEMTYEQYDKEIKYNSLTKEFNEIIKNLKYKSLQYSEWDSHIFIEKLMCIYNCEASDKLCNKNQVYRVQEENNYCYENIDYELKKFLNIIKKKSALYSFEKNKHSSLNLENYTHMTSPIRRIVDCYNQNLLVNGSIFIINLDLINEFNKNLKKAERMFHKQQLKDIVNNGKHDFYCYIFDIIDCKVSIFLPQYKLTITTRLIEKKQEEFIDIKLLNKIIEIYNKQTKNIDKSLELFKKIECKIYCINNHIYPKFKVNFNI